MTTDEKYFATSRYQTLSQQFGLGFETGPVGDKGPPTVDCDLINYEDIGDGESRGILWISGSGNTLLGADIGVEIIRRAAPGNAAQKVTYSIAFLNTPDEHGSAEYMFAEEVYDEIKWRGQINAESTHVLGPMSKQEANALLGCAAILAVRRYGQAVEELTEHAMELQRIRLGIAMRKPQFDPPQVPT